MDEALLHALLRLSFPCFVEKVFHTLHSGVAYRPNWHVEAIAHRLERVTAGEGRRLIITQPPRSLKSIVTTVAWVAWRLGHKPSLQIITISYSDRLAADHARLFRTVIGSDWYRKLFPQMRVDKSTELEVVTTAGGGRLTTSVGGSLTGRGADIIIIDDPLKADDALSEPARAAVLSWYRGTLLSRLNDKRTGVIVLVMQRLHEEDLAGYVLEQGGWDHLDLPAIALSAEAVPLGGGRIHRRRKGAVLHPERESRQALERIRREMGSLAFSAQYQQRPVPVEGNLVRREWFRWYETLTPGQAGAQVVQSWDIATTAKGHSDWSVCTTWRIDNRSDYYLLDVVRLQLEYPALRQKIQALAEHHRADVVLIEDAGPGTHLIQDLCRERRPVMPAPIGVRPEHNKAVRMEAAAARIEAGQVHLPKNAPWLAEFLHELLAFPAGRHDDQVDSVSQFLIWADRKRDSAPVSVGAPIVIFG